MMDAKHIVMFDHAAGDFGNVADMVNDGPVLIVKDNKPAYMLVSFEESQKTPAKGEGCCKRKAKQEGDNSTASSEQTHHHGHHHGGHKKSEQARPSEQQTFSAGREFNHGGTAGFDFQVPNVKIEDVVSMIPGDVIDAGQQLATKLFGLFGGPTPPRW
jgi:hypothetical protein